MLILARLLFVMTQVVILSQLHIFKLLPLKPLALASQLVYSFQLNSGESNCILPLLLPCCYKVLLQSDTSEMFTCLRTSLSFLCSSTARLWSVS